MSTMHPGAALHTSQLYGQYSQLVQPMQDTQPTPWWVWLVGGTFAVGIGVAAAVWYASRTETAPAPAPQPALQTPSGTPIEPTPQKPRLVELRFDSLPSAGVFAAGHSAELCHTPCTYNVDLSEGETTRTFVVRRDHYRDQSIEFNLADPKRAFNVSLDRIETIAPQPTNTVETVETDKATDKASDKTTGKRGRVTKKSDKKPTDKADKTVDKATETKPDPDPATANPGDKKPGDKNGTIDPTDTLDPFRRHK
jgi:hypothetical protein